jgi:alpha-1,2-mannosyltransferase
MTGRQRRLAALRAVGPVVGLGVIPALMMVEVLVAAARARSLAIDFHYAFRPAALHVLHGQSPFAPITPAALAHGTAFVYPPLAAFLMAPLAVLPAGVGDWVVTALLLLLPPLCLRLCGVRDLRCYGAVFLWAPVVWSVQTGNLSLPLALGAVLLWRYRDRVVTAAAIAAAMVAVKLFLWPVLVWLAVTRRRASSLLAVVIAGAATLGAWALVGFAGLTGFPRMLGDLSALEAPDGYSPQALALKAGAPAVVASGVRYALALAVLALAVAVARREDGDRRSFALVLAGSILASPIIWLHYLALLLVPVALSRPRFGLVWLAPVLLWVCPVRPAAPTWLTILVLAVGTAITVSVVRRGPRSQLRAREAAATAAA